MEGVEMTTKNPNKYAIKRKDSLNMTFNIADIKADMLKANNGKLTEKMQRQIDLLHKMDESDDGEISLMELIHLEENKEKVEEEGRKLKKILCAIVLLVIGMLASMMAMGIAAIEVTKESRIRGGAPIATSGSASSIAPKASSGRRLNEPWNKPATFKAAPPSTPLTAHDVSVAAQYKAEEGLTAKQKQARHEADRLAVCEKCRDAIDEEISSGARPPFNSLNGNINCEKCPICIFNAGAEVQFAAAQSCPTQPDSTDGSKKIIDQRGILYAMGSEESPISVTEEGVKFVAKTIMDADQSGQLKQEEANYQAYVQLQGTVPTIANGAPRSFVVDSSASGENFEGISKITVKMPGNSDDVVLEGKMEVAETHDGFGNEAKFVVPSTSPAVPAKEITLHADGSISLNKAAQEDFYKAKQLSPHQNMDPERKETIIKLPSMDMPIVVAEGVKSPKNMNAQEVAANMPAISASIDPVKKTMKMPSYPAQIDTVPSTISQEMEYTNYVQCDHEGARNPCTVNDYGVEKYVTGEHKDADGVIHPIYSLFKGTHVSVTQDATYMKVETMGEMKADDVSGVHMASGETLTIKNNPEGVPDQMLKEQHSYCHGDMCQTFVEETGASDAIVNMDGSITCGAVECVTGSEFLEKDTIDRNQALPAGLPQIMGGATEMHEDYVAKETRRLKQFYRKSGNIQPKNLKHTPHHLLAAHAFRQLAASVSGDMLTMFESDNCVVVEYCHEGMQYDASLSKTDQEVMAKALPGDTAGLNFRRLHIRKRRLAAKRHVNDRMATHHRVRRLVRKVHLRTRSIAKAHYNTRRRLMAMVEGAEFTYDLDDVSAQAPPFHLNSFTETALQSANDLKADMGKNYSDILSDNLYSAEYYGEEPFMTPGGTFATDPVDIAKSHKDLTCGDMPCSNLETYKIMEHNMQSLQEAKAVELEAETAVLANMQELTTKQTDDQAAFYNNVVLPSLDVLKETTYEVEQQNATLHNSADSFILENNLFKLEEYIVDNMESYVNTEEAALKAKYQATTACAQDHTAACTPDSFDVNHYLKTSSTHAHEIDNPTETYSDFSEITTAAVATQHVDDIVETLIEIGANLEAAKNKPSSCGYVSFDKTAAPDGGIKMTRQHSTRTIPAADAVYRRLKQHDYGRRRRLRGRGQYTAVNTRQRVERQVDRHREERGRAGRYSPVDAAFSRTDERMNQSPRDRESNTRSINPPERRVQNSRERRSRQTPASRRSASTDRTARTVIEERRPVVKNCRTNEEVAKADCNGCTTNPFRAAYPNARCIDICNEFRECDRMVDATAREMVKASIESSTSLTRGSRGGGRGRGARDSEDNGRESRSGGGNRRSPGVQVQIQNIGRRREDSGRRREASGYGDDRAVRNARNVIVDARETRPSPSRERDVRKSQTRGSLERERERSRGQRGRRDPRSAAIETESRLSARRRTNDNTTLDAPGAARRIVNPGKNRGPRREAMPDNLPKSVMCKETTRDRRNCSGVVSYPSDPRTNPFSVTFEHNINGPPGVKKAAKPCPNGHTCTTKVGARRACKSIGGSWDGKKWDISKGWDNACGKPGKPSTEMRIKSRKSASRKTTNKRGRGRRKLLTTELENVGGTDEELGNVSSCSHEIKERMCLDLEQDDNGKLSAQFGDLESGEFRIFFELEDRTRTKVCLSIDNCGVVILDPATVTGQATFPTRLAKRLANDCLDATGDPTMCCPGTGTMTRDIARSNGVDEFFVCDMSNMNPGTLKSQVFDVDVTIRADTTSEAPVVEISDMGHQPMRLTNGISIDYHFMQTFYPYYASLGKFCAGFEVLSNVFVPNCPECSMCENDGTDSECMKHAGHASDCLKETNCQFDNYTSECHSLPGDDNLPQTLSTTPLPCDDGEAYCANPTSGDPECVTLKDGKCLNCMDTSVFNDAIRGKRCSTPSGATCAMQGMFFCQASHECVAYCGSECKHSGNVTGVDSIGITHTSMLLGDPKSHVCAIPNPNVCHRLGKIFCEGTQDCVTECYECSHPGKEGVEFVKQRANAGVKFHGKNSHIFQGNASTCKAVDLTICQQRGKTFCKSSFGTFCTDSCNQCGEKPAKTTNGECVRPMNLPSGQYYCPANRTTGTSCAMCYYDNPYIAKYTEENATTKTCYQNPDFQLPGYYRCSIHTGKWNVEKDVTHCATECFAIDPDSNKRYAKKIHQFNDNKPYRTCEQANKNSCVKNGMVWCENDQTTMQDGTATGECQMSCANCYKPIRLDNVNNSGTPAEVGYMPLPVNDSNTCVEQKDMKKSCMDNGNYWCEGTKSCSADCYDCKGEVNVWDSVTLSYTIKVEQFSSTNEADGVCEVRCPYARRNVQYNYFWGTGETNTEEKQSTYCPLTKTCLVPDGFDSGEDPVIVDGMNMYGSSDANPCSACGTFTIQKWHNGNDVCVEETKETCNEQYNRWCPTTRKCLSWSESCEANCPGMTFTPPHYVSHDVYDSGSCMQTKAKVVEKCANVTFLNEWESPGKYCKSDYWQGCVESCESSCFSGSTSSVDDGTGFCTFQNTLVTTHNEPLDDYIPQYNRTVALEADGTETEVWIEQPQNYSSTEYTAFTEVVDPWCHYSMSSVQYCDECAATMDSNMQWTPSQMIKDMDGLTCIWPEKVYGCTDSNAVNYDPYANALYDELETCPAQTGTDHCVTCSYSSYNNSKGYSYSLPEDTLDYYGMPMNLSEPDPSMYNRSYTYP